ncbi:MAG: HPr family phosphocarrier protein [Clostridiales bacterium]|nr:HPr family phosphocarrier protein [Clostridiales bacterium]
MKEFHYKITNVLGLHARPVSLLSSLLSDVESDVFLEKNGKNVSMKRMMSVLSLDVTYGDEVTVKIIGNDEENVYRELQKFFREHL